MDVTDLPALNACLNSVSAVLLAAGYYFIRHQQGWIRPVYFTILITHIVLAATMVPMVLITLKRALRGRFGAHRRIARWTWPIWMYVSVSGVCIYVMLYRL